MLTVAERNEMLNTISDLTKAAYGFRVRKNFMIMSDDELETEWNRLVDLAEQAANEERAAFAWALKTWNAEISAIMQEHGVDKNTAVRWHRQSMNCENQEFDYYMWSCGISGRDSYEIETELGLGRMAA